MTAPSNTTAHRTPPPYDQVIRLELIRHTRTAAVPGLCYGRTDVPLPEDFAADARPVLDRLRAQADETPELILASPLARCRLLADCIAAAFSANSPDLAQKLAPELDERLRELDFGEWEGRTWTEIDATDRERSREWMNSFVHARCPGGESYAELARRTVQAINEALERPIADRDEYPRRILVITHVGPIRALVAHLLDLPLKNSFRLQVDYGSSCTVQLRWPPPTEPDASKLAFGCSDIQILGLNQA